jgi:hypothetical protein
MGTHSIQSVKASRLGSVTKTSVRKVKIKKMSIKQRFKNWLMRDDSDAPQLAIEEASPLQSDGMRFQLYKASGGFVVETRTYDRIKDRSLNSMYIIRDDQDVGEELGKIVTMETLR